MTDLLGAHMSIAGGLHRALVRDQEVGCSVVQIFLTTQPLGSGLDRHEKVGRGHLGRDPFRWLLNDRRFRGVPMAIETPKEPEPRADRQALKLLRSLLAAET
jgi:deoxyribonuclease IV